MVLRSPPLTGRGSAHSGEGAAGFSYFLGLPA